MKTYLSITEFWHWWIVATVFFGFELALPGASLLWLGFAATLCGFIFWALPGFTLLEEMMTFAAIALVTLLIWYRYFKGYNPLSTQPFLNDRASQLLGTTHTLGEPLLNGLGRIHLNDSYWRIKGPDLPKGAKIKIIDIQNGVELVVEEVVAFDDRPT